MYSVVKTTQAFFKKENESTSGLLYTKDCYAVRNIYWKYKFYKDLTSLVSAIDSELSKEIEEKRRLGGSNAYLQNPERYIPFSTFMLNSS